MKTEEERLEHSIETAEEEESSFISYLLTKGIAESSINQYLVRYRMFYKHINRKPPILPSEINEDMIWGFLATTPNLVVRACIKNFLEFKKRRDIELPKRSGRKPQKVIRVLTEQEAITLRNYLYAHNLKWGLMFDLSYWCALRRGEVCSLKVDDFYLEDWEIGKPCKLKIVKGKGRKERIVIVPPELMDLLIPFFDLCAEKGLGDGMPIFHPITGDVWRKGLRRASFKSIGRLCKPHELRHTRTTLWWQAGIDLISISKRLGHASVATTQKYTHADQEAISKAWESELTTS